MQPRREIAGPRCHVARQIGKADPAGCGGLGGVGPHVRPGVDPRHKHFDQLVFDQAVPDVGAVFDLPRPEQRHAGQTQFLLQTPVRTCVGRFAPIRMRAAGIRPKSGAVILGLRPLLDQHRAAVAHEYRHRQMPQTLAMHRKLVHRHQNAVYKRRDQVGVWRQLDHAAWLARICWCARGIVSQILTNRRKTGLTQKEIVRCKVAVQPMNCLISAPKSPA